MILLKINKLVYLNISSVLQERMTFLDNFREKKSYPFFDEIVSKDIYNYSVNHHYFFFF